MAQSSTFATARSLRAVCILGFLLGVLSIAPVIATAADPTSPQPVAAQTGNLAVPPAKPIAKPMVKPLWAELTPAQQQALSPLAAEWNVMDSVRKEKWLEIGNKFSKMKPDEQQRVQERMREWAKLTPEQRRVARENYTRAKKLNPDQKSAQWQEYQQLPEEQKKKLAAEAAAKKHVANLPSSKTKTKTVPPIKSTPKPVLEQSVTPQKVVNPFAAQPTVPPADK